MRHVQGISYVDSLDEFLPWLEQRGAARLAGPRTVTDGRNATIRHPYGLVVEYFQAGPAS